MIRQSFITIKYACHVVLVHLRSDKTYDEHNDETAHHCHGTAVDGIHKGVAEHHVNDRQSHTPYEACPYSKTCDTLPLESQHERGKEGTGEGSP